jgi:hypothetical protein
MDILNGIGLRPDGTLRYVTKNIPGRVEWWEIREARWIGMKRMKGPNRGTSSGCLRETVALKTRAAACGCLLVFHYNGT